MKKLIKGDIGKGREGLYQKVILELGEKMNKL